MGLEVLVHSFHSHCQGLSDPPPSFVLSLFLHYVCALEEGSAFGGCDGKVE
jgi:hypothetical protein